MKFIANAELNLCTENYIASYDAALNGLLDKDVFDLSKMVLRDFEFDYPAAEAEVKSVRRLCEQVKPEVKSVIGRQWILNHTQGAQYSQRFHLVDAKGVLWLTAAIEPIESNYSCNFLFWLRGSEVHKGRSCILLIRYLISDYFPMLEKLGYKFVYAQSTIKKTDNMIRYWNELNRRIYEDAAKRSEKPLIFDKPIKFKDIGLGASMRYNGNEYHPKFYRLNIERWAKLFKTLSIMTPDISVKESLTQPDFAIKREVGFQLMPDGQLVPMTEL